MSWPHLVAFGAGGASLLLEVLWVRIMAFAQTGAASAFGVTLFVYLLGIGCGAYFGRSLCRRPEALLKQFAATILLASGATDALSLIAFGATASKLNPYVAAAPWLFLGAALKGSLFPVVHHAGTQHKSSGRMGRAFSVVYLMNLAGCTAAPILVSTVTLDYWSTRSHFVIVAFLSAVMGALMLRRFRPQATAAVFGVSIFAAYLLPDPLWGTAHRPEGGEIAFWLESKEGVIHSVKALGGRGDFVFGGNVYDGRVNADLRSNENRIDRVHALMLSHEEPKDALLVGLGSGSWLRVMAGYSSVERIDAVDINPGYVRLISGYPAVAPVLDNEKVNLFFEDGRQWLRSNPGNLYDVIAVNSTFHWRSGATTLLSLEFMQELRSHLRPKGVALLNATGSVDVIRTASSVFRHVVVVGNSVIMSDTEFTGSLRDSARRLLEVNISTDVNLDPFIDRHIVQQVTGVPLLTVEEYESGRGRRGDLVTDRNLITEYRHAER